MTTSFADDSHEVAEAAFFALLHQRGGELGEPGSCIACLLSLSDELDIWLYDMVADARDAGFSWNRIAVLLDLSPPQARRRYADYCSLRSSLRPTTPQSR
jgi:non-ribosomal peptide synthetase component F